MAWPSRLPKFTEKRNSEASAGGEDFSNVFELPSETKTKARATVFPVLENCEHEKKKKLHDVRHSDPNPRTSSPAQLAGVVPAAPPPRGPTASGPRDHAAAAPPVGHPEPASEDSPVAEKDRVGFSSVRRGISPTARAERSRGGVTREGMTLRVVVDKHGQGTTHPL